MASFEIVVDSPRALDEVFGYLADFSNIAEWDPSVVEADRLTHGEIGPASRFRVVTSTAGTRQTVDYGITEWDPPRRVVLVGETSRLRAIQVLGTAPLDDGGTRITYRADLALRGPARLVDPALHVAFQLLGRRAGDGLREVLAPGQE